MRSGALRQETPNCKTCEGSVGQTRQIVGPVLLWLLVAAIIGALIDAPAWSTDISATVAITPWTTIGKIVSPIALIALAIMYILMIIRTWKTKEHLSFVRLIWGAGVTVVLTAVNFVLQQTYGAPRLCHVTQLDGMCPADTSFAYPSSFAVTAFALAVGLAYSVPWTSYLVFPLAILEAVASILSGYHYPHDVVAGLALGALGGIGALYMFIKFQARTAEKLAKKRATAV